MSTTQAVTHDANRQVSKEELEEFRAKVVAFLDKHATGIKPGDPTDRGKTAMDGAKKFQKALAEAGLAGIVYPKEYGGAGLTRAHDRVWREEYAKYPDMTNELTISHGMCLPMLNDFGTPEQRAQFQGGNISAETVWCQMFSEPGKPKQSLTVMSGS
jgi:alkylation response protein AidB-like acyl-CoA dehydrogenase